ncbi:MAG: hypothetical protein A3B81_02900 [Candidatus Muproteobacteria bacterium RIFCSPHIGHO2_02_FULL_65_16]|uniref:MSHA biogenesis protein MshK n=1 Tax=Candidatus Muproteobacteria bacterium RIFCSPHIGHO2_02_FULL_65_16 TaxID=1817766 RepID=A0A1F6U3D9_9PROT|nr:MAG: hypothetical protein A3B81_02900 [Candidatus Muproteobacteria bacterium RIFCSPHIGHO2_02_FULL_65_16]
MKVGASAIMAGLLALAPAGRAADSLAGLADPTRPQTDYVYDGPVYGGGPVLQSTMIAPGFKRAVISGRTYGIGDKLGRAVIVDIQPYEVVLKDGAGEKRLRLVPSLGKTQGAPAAAGGNQGAGKK